MAELPGSVRGPSYEGRGLTRLPRTGREIIEQFFQRAIIVLVIALAVVYALDYVILRARIATNHNPYGTVTIRPYYAVPRKDHKENYLFGDPQDTQCVHSLFPHMGDSPCWYLSRHIEQRIDM